MSGTGERGDAGATKGLPGLEKALEPEAASPGGDESLEALIRPYRLLTESSEDYIFLVDLQDVVRFCNAAGAAAFLLAPEDLQGKHVTRIFPPGVADEQMQNLQRALRTGEPISVERKTPFPGREIWLDTRLIPVPDDAGRVTAVLGVSRDITRRKQAEQALRHSEARFRSIVDDVLKRSAVGILILDASGRVVWVNRAVESFFGLPRVAFLGRDIGDLVRSSLQHCFEAPEAFSRHVLASEPTPQGTERFACRVLPGGKREERWLEYSRESIRAGLYAGGRIEHYYDITRRKETEDRLGLVSAAVNQSTEGIAVVDLEGRVLFSNQAFARMHGHEPEAIVGEHLSVFHTADQLPAVEEANRTILKTGAFSGEIWHARKDGTTFPSLMANSLICDERGEPFAIIGTLRDITERKRMEEELLRARRVESLGTLAGGIAHDFNNILTAISVNVSVARLCVRPEEEVHSILSEAENACVRAKSLTNQLLTFSRGGMPVKKPTTIAHLVRETAQFALRGSSARCEFHLPEDLWPLEVDEGQISQAIHNLILNADQAMPEGGVIRVLGRNRSIAENEGLPLPPGPYVEIAVRDRGEGIAEEQMEQIFDPYYTTKEDGSGLGLTSTFSIVRKHGGHINLESRPGEGATFRIYLPASDRRPGPAPERKPAGHSRPRLRVLLMDDEELIRQNVGRSLERRGFEVVLVVEGAEAVQAYRQARESGRPFDAVIMDLTIPGGMGGKEAIREIQAIGPDVKAIVTSGYSNDPVMAQYVAHGFHGVVSKPFRIEELEETLFQVVEGQKA